VELWRRRRWRGAMDLGRLGSLAVTPSPPGTGRESGSRWPGRSGSMDVLGWLIWASPRAAAPSPGPMNVNIKDLYAKNINTVS